MWPPGDGSLSYYAADLVSDLMASDAEALGISVRQRLLDAAIGYRTYAEAPVYVRQLLDLASDRPDARNLTSRELTRGPVGVGNVAIFVEGRETRA